MVNIKNLSKKLPDKKYAYLILTVIFLIVWTTAVVKFINWRDARIFRSPIVFQDPILIRADVEETEISEEPQVNDIPVTTNSPITLRLSSYWPPLGGTNCSAFINGECLSKMASGERWQDWDGLAMACPVELKFGTKIEIDGWVWECQDRGGAIIKIGDVYWVDLLTPDSPFDYGEIVEAMEII